MPDRTTVRIKERQFLLRVITDPSAACAARNQSHPQTVQHINRAATCFVIGSSTAKNTIGICAHIYPPHTTDRACHVIA